jgi:uncharacterized membrane protein YheB (UPF0754 family)
LSPELARAVLTVLFGALAGGLTNTVAVWMLFHPYEPPRFGRFRLRFLHGAIPKNQERLAQAVGRTVGDRLLTPEDLSGILTNREFRSAFDSRLQRFTAELLDTERGSLREVLPGEMSTALEGLLDGAADLMDERLDSWLQSGQFEEFVEARVPELLSRISRHPVRDILTTDREGALAGAVDSWVAELVHRESFQSTVEGYVGRTFQTFLRDDRTFEEVLPAGLAGAFERALSGYLPIAVRKLGGILEDPEARRRLEATMHDLFQKFLTDLRFHQRVVARLVVTEETLAKVLETLEEEGAEHLSEMLRDPTVQDATARRINDAVVDFLQRPVTSVLGRPGDESVDSAQHTVVGWIVGMARDPETLDFLLERIRNGIHHASEGTWGELLDRVPSDRLSGAVVAAARSAPARNAYRDVLGRLLRGLLDRPIGRPGAWLPDGSSVRLRAALSDPLWGWLQAQTPEVVRTLDIGRRVEEKVRDYPTVRLEELVRRVTNRELKMIVRLGYVLGAVIGAVLVGVNALFS